jgi:hypothetical protein
MKNDKIITTGEAGVICKETAVAYSTIPSQTSSTEKQEINKNHQPMNTH